MRILKVIHGYPMRYNAGSEVYSQALCHGMVDAGHDVAVFTREENPFVPDYLVTKEQDSLLPEISLYLINLPLEKHRYSYRDSNVDEQFERVLRDFQPDIIHIGHLNHLSCSIIEKIPLSIPILYTLHDYWLICPRGQLIQRLPEDLSDVWHLCDGPDPEKCAQHCYSGYYSRAIEDLVEDKTYWTSWVKRRQTYIKKMIERIDYFIAPAQFLLRYYQQFFDLPRDKICYLDYGFNLRYLSGRKRHAEKDFVFGYIGTHIPAKGVQLLIDAFGKLSGHCRLRIWGRERGQNTAALHLLEEALSLEQKEKIEWMGEYQNQHIVTDVFNQVDAIVVPSIWFENSPLVIHEALQLRLPVITADVGGMAEYVKHEQNGLLFKHRDASALAEQMQRLLDEPTLGNLLAEKGYLYSSTGNIPEMHQHVNDIEQIYRQLLSEKKV